MVVKWSRVSINVCHSSIICQIIHIKRHLFSQQAGVRFFLQKSVLFNCFYLK
jgi:hypothetical protein